MLPPEYAAFVHRHVRLAAVDGRIMAGMDDLFAVYDAQLNRLLAELPSACEGALAARFAAHEIRRQVPVIEGAGQMVLRLTVIGPDSELLTRVVDRSPP